MRLNRIIGQMLWLGRGTATIMGLALMVEPWCSESPPLLWLRFRETP